MEVRRVVPYIVGVTGFLGVVAGGLITLATGNQLDYADLVPPPNEVILREDTEQTVWLSTNRHEVEMRIDSVDVGLGGVNRLADTGETVVLGQSTGCFPTAVAGILVENTSATSVDMTFTLDPGQHVAADVFTMYFRLFVDGVKIADFSVSVTVPSTGDTTYSRSYSGLLSGGKYRLEASTTPHFPYTATRAVEWTQTEGGEDVTAPGASEHIDLLEQTGVGLIGCNENENVLITLHGDDGEELNRYEVDVLEVPTPTPLPNRPPVFGDAYYARHICTDQTDIRANYFDGNEILQGAAVTATDPDNDAITYSLGSSEDHPLDYAFFQVSNSGQIRVSEAGADNDIGLDGSRLYAFVLEASDGHAGTASATIAVHVRLIDSLNDNGSCS